MGVNVNRVNAIGEILRRFGLPQGGGLRPGIILLDPPTWCEPRWYMYVYVYMCVYVYMYVCTYVCMASVSRARSAAAVSIGLGNIFTPPHRGGSSVE